MPYKDVAVQRKAVIAHRQNVKRKLVEHHGSKCVDCEYIGPAFMYDFDHKDPSEKSFGISDSQSRSYARALAESLKCDLVCSNCHRMRTHVQRCKGCEHCPTSG